MTYKDMVLGTLTQTAIDERDNTYFEMAKQVDEAYRKAKVFDEVSKYVKQKLSAKVPLNDDYLIGRFESYETIQELMERAEDER